jgi:hypothetical protein
MSKYILDGRRPKQETPRASLYAPRQKTSQSRVKSDCLGDGRVSITTHFTLHALTSLRKFRAVNFKTLQKGSSEFLKCHLFQISRP